MGGVTRKILFLLAGIFLILFFRIDSVHTAASHMVISLHTRFSFFISSIASVPRAIGHIFAYEDFLEEKEALLARIQELETERALQDEIWKDYILLREHAGLRPLEGARIARVISSPPNDPFDSMLINKGKNDGITEGMKAIVFGYVYAGTVEEVFERSARISLLSRFEKETQLTLAEQNSLVVAKGEGARTFSIDVPRDFKVEEGNRLIFFHNQPLLAGVIEQIDRRTSQSVLRARAVIPFNPKGITTLILLP